jgi:hypothetical protein
MCWAIMSVEQIRESIGITRNTTSNYIYVSSGNSLSNSSNGIFSEYSGSRSGIGNIGSNTDMGYSGKSNVVGIYR